MTSPAPRLRISDERGWVIVSATILTLLMLTVGLAAAALIDSGTARSQDQRERESALNVDEGVLYAQSLVMQTAWPSSATVLAGQPQFYPATCKSSGLADRRCPNPQTLVAANSTTPGSALFRNVDQLADVSWTTKVRDNGGALANAFDPKRADELQPGCVKTGATNACTYDANGDRELWVQAQAIVRGKPRNVVARLRLEQLAESMPRTAVVAGALSITNSGNHGGTPIIDAQDSQVIVRCPNAGDEQCANYEDGQVKPIRPTSDVAAPNLMTPDQLQRFKQRAIMDNRYYPGCPTAGPDGKFHLEGRVVWVEGCPDADLPNLTSKVVTASCAPPSGLDPDCVNTEASAGLLIWHCGRADMAGGWTYRGVLYIVNNSDGTCAPGMPQQRGNGTCSSQPHATAQDAITTNGGFGVWGAVAVDGPACLKLGSNGVQVFYDSRVFDDVQSYGTVGLVQNTWRELNPRDI